MFLGNTKANGYKDPGALGNILMSSNGFTIRVSNFWDEKQLRKPAVSGFFFGSRQFSIQQELGSFGREPGNSEFPEMGTIFTIETIWTMVFISTLIRLVGYEGSFRVNLSLEFRTFQVTLNSFHFPPTFLLFLPPSSTFYVVLKNVII